MRNLDLDVMFQRAACLPENLVGRQRASAIGVRQPFIITRRRACYYGNRTTRVRLLRTVWRSYTQPVVNISHDFLRRIDPAGLLIASQHSVVFFWGGQVESLCSDGIMYQIWL